MHIYAYIYRYRLQLHIIKELTHTPREQGVGVKIKNGIEPKNQITRTQRQGYSLLKCQACACASLISSAEVTLSKFLNIYSSFNTIIWMILWCFTTGCAAF